MGANHHGFSEERKKQPPSAFKLYYQSKKKLYLRSRRRVDDSLDAEFGPSIRKDTWRGGEKKRTKESCQ